MTEPQRWPPPDVPHHLTVRPPAGTRVLITRLMYKVNQVSEPNYVVAGVLGMPPVQLSLYMRGREPIRSQHLEKMCRVFGCEPEDVMGWVEVDIAEVR